MGMAMDLILIIIHMDDAFTLNCCPTVPVGCEEQVDIKIYRLFSFSSYATLKHLTIT